MELTKLYFAILVLFLTARLGHSHVSISLPEPISFVQKCRAKDQVGYCGPCPRERFRPGQDANNPLVKVRRGDTLVVRTRKNNHSGGFLRWSMVNLKDMYDFRSHAQEAFLYECNDKNPRKCSPENARKICGPDENRIHYKHEIKIPTVYPDGNYTMGMAWYGGMTGPAIAGAFGDYYDCMYIHIQGGPTKDQYKPRFLGESMYGNGTHCKSTVDRLGICTDEPCEAGKLKGKLSKPFEFKSGRVPKSLYRSRFEMGLTKPAASPPGKFEKPEKLFFPNLAYKTNSYAY